MIGFVAVRVMELQHFAKKCEFRWLGSQAVFLWTGSAESLQEYPRQKGGFDEATRATPYWWMRGSDALADEKAWCLLGACSMRNSERLGRA